MEQLEADKLLGLRTPTRAKVTVAVQIQGVVRTTAEHTLNMPRDGRPAYIEILGAFIVKSLKTVVNPVETDGVDDGDGACIEFHTPVVALNPVR